MRSEPFGDVILVPGEDAYGFADGDKVQAELHLTAEPCFGSTQAEGFSVYASQRIFAVRTEAFGDGEW